MPGSVRRCGTRLEKPHLDRTPPRAEPLDIVSGDAERPRAEYANRKSVVSAGGRALSRSSRPGAPKASGHEVMATSGNVMPCFATCLRMIDHSSALPQPP